MFSKAHKMVRAIVRCIKIFNSKGLKSCNVLSKRFELFYFINWCSFLKLYCRKLYTCIYVKANSKQTLVNKSSGIFFAWIFLYWNFSFLAMASRTGKFLAERFKTNIPLHLSQLPATKRLLIHRLWETGIRGRLPRHYVKFYQQWEKGPETPIHYRPKPARFEKNEFGQVVRIENPKIPVLYPEEFHQVKLL